MISINNFIGYMVEKIRKYNALFKLDMFLSDYSIEEEQAYD